MPDATEWLVEYEDQIDGHQHEHVLDREKAIEYVRQLTGQGKTVALYQRVDFTVTVDVTVKSPRRRRKKEAKEGAASAHAEQGAVDPGMSPGAKRSRGDAQQATAEPTASPVFPWTCEANFDGDPKCPGPVTMDPWTRGWFCGLHMTAIPQSGRLELHRKHASRNRRVRVAHAG